MRSWILTIYQLSLKNEKLLFFIFCLILIFQHRNDDFTDFIVNLIFNLSLILRRTLSLKKRYWNIFYLSFSLNEFFLKTKLILTLAFIFFIYYWKEHNKSQFFVKINLLLIHTFKKDDVFHFLTFLFMHR